MFFLKKAAGYLLAGSMGALLLNTTLQAADVEDSLDVVATTNNNAAASQQTIDKLSRETRNLLEDYRKLLDGSEYQAAYTRELKELDEVQQLRLAELREQINQARITQQRIVPLMRSMADSLEKFVILDLPFHQEERIVAALALKQRLRSPDISVSAKFRILLEAYQLEQNYGSNIESWRGPLQQDGEVLSVQYLRIGRVALFYQLLDGSSSGYWDNQQGQWLPLEARYNRGLMQAVRVAENITAPQLLNLPLRLTGEAS
tara:strand:- start:63358 stop:64137 length:780 start_codon:yes stop_codon:yes gene_type:complete